MKKTVVLISLLILVVACQQKQEQSGQGQSPVGLNSSMADVSNLQEVVKKDPKNVGAWIELGNIFMDSQRFSEAVDAYQKALVLDPKNVDVRVDMGTCYRKIGKPDKAVEEYKEALKINPNHLNAHKNLGIVLAFDLKERAEAIKELEKYLELAPNAPDADKAKQLIQQIRSAK
ncbi:MAG: tetratricopeptide repeat protein [Thermodesulfovibrionales bacterium]|jgi:tetratricopeptide (TPR) repeat protein